MAVQANLTKSANIAATAREIAFVTSFATNWQHLREIMGVMRMIEKPAGTVLKSKYAEVTLNSNAVAEGDEIPLSQAEVKTKDYNPITVEKFAKSVSIEAISDHGYDDAVARTDEQFLFELTANVTGRFYDFLNTGTLISAKATFQAALAEAQGRVRNKWKKMKRGITDVVGFCNILDAYDYLGAANISVQSEFGMNYIENFIGYRRLFLCADEEVARDKVLATPMQNMVCYHVNPADSDYARAGLAYTVDGETDLIGFHVQGNYSRATSETYALMGLTMMAEYLDGIAAVDIGTETYTAVDSSGEGYASKNPVNEGWFEKSGDDYFPTADTEVAAGKTYYARTVTKGA